MNDKTKKSDAEMTAINQNISRGEVPKFDEFANTFLRQTANFGRRSAKSRRLCLTWTSLGCRGLCPSKAKAFVAVLIRECNPGSLD